MPFAGFLNGLSAPEAVVLAATALCPAPEQKPVVEVLFKSVPTVYSEAHDSHYIMTEPALNTKDSTRATDKRYVTLGVTSSAPAFGVGMDYGMRQFVQSGKQCMYITKVTYEIHYAPSVYVSSDILDLKCTYGVTRAHEQQHVSIDYKVMQAYLPTVKKNIEAYLTRFAYRPFGPFAQDRMDANKKMIMEQMRVAASPIIEQLFNERRRWQGSIDTDANYKREADKCPQDRQAIHEKFFKDR